jgi:hypothetical protein
MTDKRKLCTDFKIKPLKKQKTEILYIIFQNVPTYITNLLGITDGFYSSSYIFSCINTNVKHYDLNFNKNAVIWMCDTIFNKIVNIPAIKNVLKSCILYFDEKDLNDIFKIFCDTSFTNIYDEIVKDTCFIIEAIRTLNIKIIDIVLNFYGMNNIDILNGNCYIENKLCSLYNILFKIDTDIEITQYKKIESHSHSHTLKNINKITNYFVSKGIPIIFNIFYYVNNVLSILKQEINDNNNVLTYATNLLEFVIIKMNINRNLIFDIYLDFIINWKQSISFVYYTDSKNMNKITHTIMDLLYDFQSKPSKQIWQKIISNEFDLPIDIFIILNKQQYKCPIDLFNKYLCSGKIRILNYLVENIILLPKYNLDCESIYYILNNINNNQIYEQILVSLLQSNCIETIYYEHIKKSLNNNNKNLYQQLKKLNI